MASYCAGVTARSMTPLLWRVAGEIFSLRRFLARKGPMPRTEFIATGFHVPERVVTNDDLSTMMDTSDEWMSQRWGLKTRHWASDGERGATPARVAAQQ